jgi:hypothetical protein
MAYANNTRDLQIVDPVLTTVARRYTPEGFVYNKLLPTIQVDVDSNQYPVFAKEYWFRSLAEPRVSDRAETPEVAWEWSTDTFLCEDFRLKATITRKERRQAHPALKMEMQKLEHLLNQMALNREIRAAAQLLPTGNGGQLTGGSANATAKFTQDTATIEADIKTGKVAVYKKTARVPNTIVIPYLVAVEIAMQQDIREIIKYTVDGRQVLDLGEAVLPSKLWGMNVLVPQGALYDTGAEGTTVTDLTEIWGDTVRLLYVAPRGGGWGIPSVGYSFKSLPEEVDRWRTDDPPIDNIRAWETVDEKICAPELGYCILDCL